MEASVPGLGQLEMHGGWTGRQFQWLSLNAKARRGIPHAALFESSCFNAQRGAVDVQFLAALGCCGMVLWRP